MGASGVRDPGNVHGELSRRPREAKGLEKRPGLGQGMGKMTLGWGKVVQLIKSKNSGARCLSSCPSSTTSWLSHLNSQYKRVVGSKGCWECQVC